MPEQPLSQSSDPAVEKLILEPSALAQWHALVKQAEDSYGCHLDEAMESYLVFTLMRFMSHNKLGATALAADYLDAQNLPKSLRLDQLRDVGDQCLILSGLFPQRAEKRLVRVSYYVNMGRSAYHHLSGQIQQSTAELYRELAETFVTLMDLLQTIRGFNSSVMQPIQALELWSDTGSQRAFASLNGDSTPLHESLINPGLKQ
ncbi:MAG: hypothetical protein WBN96_10815 [Gammaproteobacteria bacterium]